MSYKLYFLIIMPIIHFYFYVSSSHYKFMVKLREGSFHQNPKLLMKTYAPLIYRK